jgi:hypothetical protein
MKYLKVLAIAVIALFAVEGAKAQVVVSARIGSAPVYHPRRTVVVTRHAYRPRPVYRRHVVVARHGYRAPHRRMVARQDYHRNYDRHVVRYR